MEKAEIIHADIRERGFEGFIAAWAGSDKAPGFTCPARVINISLEDDLSKAIEEAENCGEAIVWNVPLEELRLISNKLNPKSSSAGTLLDEFRGDIIIQHPGFKKMSDAINRLAGLKETDSAEYTTKAVREAAAELESALPALQTVKNLSWFQAWLHIEHQEKLPRARWIVKQTLTDLNSLLLTDGRLIQDTTPCALVLQADDVILEQFGWIREALKSIKEKLGVEVVITNDIPETILALSERHKDSIKRENIIAGIFKGYDEQGRINNMLSQSNVLVMENVKELQRFPFFKLAILTRAMVSIHRVDLSREKAVYKSIIPVLWRAITGEPMPVSVDTFLANPADALLSWHIPEATLDKITIKLLQEQAARIFA
jgi:hypothetical protein